MVKYESRESNDYDLKQNIYISAISNILFFSDDSGMTVTPTTHVCADLTCIRPVCVWNMDIISNRVI